MKKGKPIIVFLLKGERAQKDSPDKGMDNA